VANAIPTSAAPKKEPKETPKAPANVEYVGEGADKVKFTVDPKAKHTRVYSSGMIVVTY